jgi:2-dehydro-3-deoxygluconokinase
MLGIDPVKKLGKTDDEDLEEVCKRVMKNFPSIKTVALSLRDNVTASHNRLSGALYHQNQLVKSPIYEINPIVDRIGGGDAFMAGLVYGLTQFSSQNQEIINYAVGASVLKHTIKGDVNLVNAQEVQQFVTSNGTGYVAR